MTEPITNLEDAVAALGALPMPVGTVAVESNPRIAMIRKTRTHCEADPYETEDERPVHVWGPSQYPGMQMCQLCTVRRDWAEDPDADDVVLLAEVDRLRARVAELEAEQHVANGVLDDAASALRERPDGITRLIAPTQARRDDVTPQVQKLRDLLAGQRSALEDGHESPLHHSYRVGRDLPEPGGA
jgi:hypothetical protein